MLNKPALVDMMKKVDSKYSLVIIASKRARAMVDKNPEMLLSCSINPVTKALEEIMSDQLHWNNDVEPHTELPQLADEEAPETDFGA